MLSKLICHKHWNISRTELSPKLKRQQKLSVTKPEMSPKLNCHETELSPKTEISSKLGRSPKLKCNQNWNVTKTLM